MKTHPRASRIPRREFLKRSGAAGLTVWLGAPAALAGRRRPRRFEQKLRIGVFGCGGRGGSNLGSVGGEEIVALCDPDRSMAAKAIEQYPDLPFFTDYRECLAEAGEHMDAVVVSTPDHMHAPIAVAAMKQGLHCYCEKPLTWSVQEARTMAHLAAANGLATQMGNQGTASDGFRRGVEALRAGVLGPVSAVHVWTNRPVWPQALNRPEETPEVPGHLDWEAWIGCAPDRPYHPAYLPFRWRGWYDFGTGALGDMACHTVNLAYMGLDLGSPTRIEAETTELFPESYPAGSHITWDFPARGDRPAVKLHWYDGSMSPPKGLLTDRETPGSGCLIVGEDASLFSPDDYGAAQVMPAAGGEGGFEAPEPWLPRSPGHHAEWIAACKGEVKTMSHFGHAGPFTESMLLGNLAMRTGKVIQWDAQAMKAKGVPEADALIRRHYLHGHGIQA